MIIPYWVCILSVYLGSSTFTWFLFLRSTPVVVRDTSSVKSKPYLEPSYPIEVIGPTRSVFILFQGSKTLVAGPFDIRLA